MGSRIPHVVRSERREPLNGLARPIDRPAMTGRSSAVPSSVGTDIGPGGNAATSSRGRSRPWRVGKCSDNLHSPARLWSRSPSAPISASAQDRFALVIGNSNYKSVSPLTNPARDADAVGVASEGCRLPGHLGARSRQVEHEQGDPVLHQQHRRKAGKHRGADLFRRPRRAGRRREFPGSGRRRDRARGRCSARSDAAWAT